MGGTYRGNLVAVFTGNTSNMRILGAVGRRRFTLAALTPTSLRASAERHGQSLEYIHSRRRIV